MKITQLLILASTTFSLVFTPINGYTAKGKPPGPSGAQRYAAALNDKLARAVMSTKYDATLQKYANQYGLDWVMLKGLIMTESSLGLNKGKSSAGAMGIAQFMPDTAKWRGGVLGIDVYASDENGIRASAEYLRYLLKRKDNDIVRALGSYNWGEGNEGKIREGTGLERLKAGKYPWDATVYPIRIAKYYLIYGGNGSFKPVAEAILNGQGAADVGTMTLSEVQNNCMADPSAFLSDSDGFGNLELPDALTHEEMSVNEMIDHEAHRRLVNDEWDANVAKVSSRALWVDYTHALATENYIERLNQEKRQNIEQLTSQLVSLKVQNENKPATQNAHNDALSNKIINGAPSNGGGNNTDPWWKFW